MLCPYCKTENLPEATKCAACSSWIVSPPPVREWTRARHGRYIAGVCRGLSNRFGIPLAAARLLFVASIFFGGWGILLYLALWIAMPLEPQAAIAGEMAAERVERVVLDPGEPATGIVLSRAASR